MTLNFAAGLTQLAAPDLEQARIVLVVVFLMLAGYIDLRTYRIPNWLTLGGALIGLGLSTAIPWTVLGPAWAIDGFLSALGGIAVGLAVLLPFYLLRVMGAGDVKLMAMVGAFLGLSQIVPAMLASFLAGGVAAVVYVVAHQRTAQFRANVRQLMHSATLSAFAGLPFTGVPHGASAGRLPYGVSICAGTVGYLVAGQLGYL